MGSWARSIIQPNTGVGAVFFVNIGGQGLAAIQTVGEGLEGRTGPATTQEQVHLHQRVSQHHGTRACAGHPRSTCTAEAAPRWRCAARGWIECAGRRSQGPWSPTRSARFFRRCVAVSARVPQSPFRAAGRRIRRASAHGAFRAAEARNWGSLLSPSGGGGSAIRRLGHVVV
jgi:hypothetical protein